MTGGATWVVMCQLCREQPDDAQKRGDSDYIDCPRCGKYEISDLAQSILKTGSYNDSRWLLRAVVRNASDRGQVLKLTTDSIPRLIAAAPIPRGPLEVMDRVLLHFGGERSGPGFHREVRLPMSDYPLFYLSDTADLSYTLSALTDAGYLRAMKIENNVAHAHVTVKGWERIAELQRTTTNSWQAFVAMRFSLEMAPAFDDGIKPALHATGYSAIRVDRLQHNEKIDDKIIAELRRSGLVVADFTEHRGGVYFEAGFGMGRNVPVIFTCRHDHIEQAHFDTRQYNHIVWTDPADLGQQLTDRIRATLPTRTPIVQ